MRKKIQEKDILEWIMTNNKLKKVTWNLLTRHVK